MTRPNGTAGHGLREWLGNIVHVIWTVAQALVVTMRYWLITYNPARGTFTEKYEYPELPVPVAPRFRGFHRYDLTSCGGCGVCARDCPVQCIYISRERQEGKKGFRVTGFAVDYSKCMFCGICVESCPTECLFMGSSHDLSGYSRDGCLVDFAKLPLEVAWSRAALNPTVVIQSKVVTEPVHGGPGS